MQKKQITEEHENKLQESMCYKGNQDIGVSYIEKA